MHTNRTTDSNHLQVTTLQPTLERGVSCVLCGGLDIETRAIGSSMARDGMVRVTLETVPNALSHASPSGLRTAIGGGSLGWSLDRMRLLELLLVHGEVMNSCLLEMGVMYVEEGKGARQFLGLG
jgi:hypothetical protein